MGKDTTKKVAIGALIAGAAGYVAGLLTAPKSGKETRKDVKIAAIKAKNTAEKQLKELHSELSEYIAKAKTGATKFKDVANDDFDKAIKAAVGAKDKVREMLTALHEGGAEDKDLKQAISDATKAIDHLKQFANKK